MNTQSLKRTVIISIGIMMLAACKLTGTKQATATIGGRFPLQGGNRIYLNKYTPGGLCCIDSLITGPDGSFNFTFVVDGRDIYRLYFSLNNGRDLIITPEDRIVLSSDRVSLRGAKADGLTGANRSIAYLDSLVMSGEASLDSIIDMSVMENDLEVKNRLLSSSKVMEKELGADLKLLIDTIASSPGDPLLRLYLAGISFHDRPVYSLRDDVALLLRLVQDAEAIYPGSGFVRHASAMIRDYSASRLIWMENEKMNIPGSPVKQLLLEDVYGRPAVLYNSLGKYTLLYFWRSDCLYCREMTDQLARLYEVYHSRGLEIFSISLDEDMVTLSKYLDENPVRWTVAADHKGWRSPILSRFNILGTPTLYLLDSSGLIMGRDYGGEELQMKMHQLFNN